MADIVSRYMERNPGIELVGRPERLDRSFTGKAHAFNAGYEAIKTVPYEIIGNLDGDISFDNDHFEFLLTKFSQHP
jgi:biofilm PGA synthesis N-glycosyltransferase PgaC